MELRYAASDHIPLGGVVVVGVGRSSGLAALLVLAKAYRRALNCRGCKRECGRGDRNGEVV